MRFELTLDCDSDDPRNVIGAALRFGIKLDNLDPNDTRYGANEGKVLDVNGNTIGKWTFTADVPAWEHDESRDGHGCSYCGAWAQVNEDCLCRECYEEA